MQNFLNFLRRFVLFIIPSWLFCYVSIAYTAPKGIFSKKYAAIVMDANSGKILHQIHADARRYPASLTKMMTLYMLFEEMQAGRISRNTPIQVSAYAASRPPTKLGITPGQTISVEIAAKALITRSANDVATAIGEYLAGSERNFAKKMTLIAHRLGMRNTKFTNASGLPDKDNYSTARDMAILSLALREHFPQQYDLFNITKFDFHGRKIVSHNKLVRSMKGVDGIKTGFVRMSGFNLASSRRQGKKSIVAVIMGGETAAYRDSHMANLLEKYIKQASSIKTITSLVPRRRSLEKATQVVKVVAIPIPKDCLTFFTSSRRCNNIAHVAAIPARRPAFVNRRQPDLLLLLALTSNITTAISFDHVTMTVVDSVFIPNIPIPIHK